MEPLLRQLIMGVSLRPRPPDSYAALLRELSAIGNNINQLAHQANARDDATKAEIDEAAQLVRQAWRMVRTPSDPPPFSQVLMKSSLASSPLILYCRQFRSVV